jgi:hypothetical protein
VCSSDLLYKILLKWNNARNQYLELFKGIPSPLWVITAQYTLSSWHFWTKFMQNLLFELKPKPGMKTQILTGTSLDLDSWYVGLDGYQSTANWVPSWFVLISLWYFRAIFSPNGIMEPKWLEYHLLEYNILTEILKIQK